MGQLAKQSKFRSLAEAEEFMESCAAQFNAGMEQFAAAIKEVKEAKLYLSSPGVATFAQYCEQRWGRTVRTVQRALNAHETREKLLADAPPEKRANIRKKTTRQIREIAALPEEKQLAVATAPEMPRRIDFYATENPPPRRETEDQIVARRIRAFATNQDESYREYLGWVADQFSK